MGSNVRVGSTPILATKLIDMETKLLIEKCEAIVDRVVAKEFREEAKEIVRLTTDKHRQDLIKYDSLDQGNICCLVLDAAMYDLINEGKISNNGSHAFGNLPFS